MTTTVLGYATAAYVAGICGAYLMGWYDGGRDQRRFRDAFALTFGATALFCIVILWR
jgi:hypothetical protein